MWLQMPGRTPRCSKGPTNRAESVGSMPETAHQADIDVQHKGVPLRNPGAVCSTGRQQVLNKAKRLLNRQKKNPTGKRGPVD